MTTTGSSGIKHKARSSSPPRTRPTGLLSLLPYSWIPYAQLARLDRTAGFYALYIPHLIGLFYAACLHPHANIPSPYHLLYLCTVFLLHSILLRAAACAWNDNCDQGYDRQVARCKNRPIARGAISTSNAHIFTMACAMLNVLLLVPANLPPKCIYHIFPMYILFFAYAFMKRITHYPQVFLGIPFAWAIPMSCAALGIDPLSRQYKFPTTALCMSNVAWTVIYDTIYAHQDVDDDQAAGVKSMAVRFKDSTKPLASILAFIQISLLGFVGWSVNELHEGSGLGPGDFSWVYFASSVLGAGLTLEWMIWKVELKDPGSCAWFFKKGFWYVGGAIVGGLVGEWWTRWNNMNVF